jgi:thioredoxin 1
MGVAELSGTQLAAFVGKNPVVLVDCWAPWCGPCRVLSPTIEALSKEMPRVAFAKINVDDNASTAQQYGIMSIPTMLIFKQGKLVDRLVGALPKPLIVKALEKHLAA